MRPVVLKGLGLWKVGCCVWDMEVVAGRTLALESGMTGFAPEVHTCGVALSKSVSDPL
jgi:hypothetical protein